MAKKNYFFPIVIKNRRLAPFKISPKIRLRRMTKKERIEFFGLEKVDCEFESTRFGHIKTIQTHNAKKEGRYPCRDMSYWERTDRFTEIVASNYILVLDDVDDPISLMDELNLTFILFKPTSTGGFICFSESETSHYVTLDNPVGGPFDYLDLKKKDLEEIKKIFLLIQKNKKDKKFKLYSDLYYRALQGGRTRAELRFLLLVMALDSMYCPDSRAELSFRLSSRAATILSKYGKLRKPIELFDRIKKIYDIRSDFVHKGESRKFNSEIFAETANYVRASLNLYLKDKSLFSDNSLKYAIF